jgi:hypothetical protein
MHQAGAANGIRPIDKYTSLPRSMAQFSLHLAMVYLLAKFAVVWLGGEVHNVILPLLRLPSSAGTG